MSHLESCTFEPIRNKITTYTNQLGDRQRGHQIFMANQKGPDLDFNQWEMSKHYQSELGLQMPAGVRLTIILHVKVIIHCMVPIFLVSFSKNFLLFCIQLVMNSQPCTSVMPPFLASIPLDCTNTYIRTSIYIYIYVYTYDTEIYTYHQVLCAITQLYSQYSVYCTIAIMIIQYYAPTRKKSQHT